jgi:hypothetical protein
VFIECKDDDVTTPPVYSARPNSIACVSYQRPAVSTVGMLAQIFEKIVEIEIHMYLVSA